MDFFKISERKTKSGIEIFPDFIVKRANDFMVRGKSFYAIWDAEAGLWSTDEQDVVRLVDSELKTFRDKRTETSEYPIIVRWMSSSNSKSWALYKRYVSDMFDNYHLLDSKLTFRNTKVKKTDYISKRLDYPLEDGDYSSYDKLMSVLYSSEERAKIEWAIGSIVAGDASKIQKFLVLYGSAGTGKSTLLNIVQKLFDGYYTIFDAKSLSTSSNQFASTFMKSNPLLAIQHDGDLSHIEDNTRINSIVSHEEIIVNEKFKSEYIVKPLCFLMLATNKPVKITDAKSGIIRRLIDVRPTGKRLGQIEYQSLYSQLDFELGAIAKHCLDVYQSMGIHYYDDYVPTDMLYQTDLFYNFVEENYILFRRQDTITLTQAYALYKEYISDSGLAHAMPRYRFREELKNYFSDFKAIYRNPDGTQTRSVYSGFLDEKFAYFKETQIEEHPSPFVLDCSESILDEILADCPAQYANEEEKPSMRWESVKTCLKDLDTTKVHYVRLPENHIVIDFDLRDDNGDKSAEKCLLEATKWPLTYAEFSKGGKGLHLHYIWNGDVTKLSRLYDEGIEIKVFTGKSSLRRRLTKCNNVPIATLSSGLPMKEETVVNFENIKNEKAIRTLIQKNMDKEYLTSTKQSIDFIAKILDEAYASGMKYDVSDMITKITAFANNATNQAQYCLNVVSNMKFKSDEESSSVDDDGELIFFDVEVFPNLFLVNWKTAGDGRTCVEMINPSSQEIENLFSKRLVGFNNRRYDNHILYARYLGYTNEELYHLSQRIIGGDKNAFFREAYNISYTDIFDFSSKKQSLKKFEIELGIHHQELGLPWDEPVPEDKWQLVAEYCNNDVLATEAVFNSRKADWVARQLLADLSGLSVNDSTQQHAAKIIFGNDPHPQDKFVYTDLSETFPGYIYKDGQSSYRGENPKEGGYVFAKEGIYFDVGVLDVASMHPHSIKELNIFGPYTENYNDIVKARLYIKHDEIDKLSTVLDGKLTKYISDDSYTKADLAYAMKIIINIVYGLTAAKFDNKFRDPRNVDNIVAKRGALFMIDLKNAVLEKGYDVIHIKTDSIKIPNITPEIIEFVKEFGKKYGYTFEHECTYSRMCLVNHAVYIAQYKDGDHANEWVAVGDQFAEPYVFKTLFSKEPLIFSDYCQTKNVKVGVMYLDRNESLGEDEHEYQFVGKTGLFCPVKPGAGGGWLVCKNNDKYSAVTGTKGWRWLEAEAVVNSGLENYISTDYYKNLADKAIENISKYGDFEMFVTGGDVDIPF